MNPLAFPYNGKNLVLGYSILLSNFKFLQDPNFIFGTEIADIQIYNKINLVCMDHLKISILSKNCRCAKTYVRGEGRIVGKKFTWLKKKFIEIGLCSFRINSFESSEILIMGFSYTLVFVVSMYRCSIHSL